ncbi:hypothetical protein [Streptomyces sp. STCH 565 A]|uniref:hypothetical protein n=1 Tax=Streptomyces sp. STCH 565 A TaxID=2950532 RepID=UPI002075FB93|nr:hypothetical protein [Streptomyces sp. STCH 565 A]MCM8555340.1 hypothetical protein [Streptomyces sp. STCH 565 A]
MGYRPKRKIFKLDFTGTDWEGLEVSVRGMTFGEELDLDSKDFTVEVIAETLSMLLVSWNVEDDQGAPVPATIDGLRTQDTRMVTAILTALRQANSGVAAPLPTGSPSGGPSPEASIPMAPLSPSPENSAVPA